LLVYGSGVHWGTAYLGPDGHTPDTAGTLVTATDSFTEPQPELEPTAAPGPGPELVDIAAGEHLAEDPIPVAGSVKAVKRTGLSDAAGEIPLAQQVKRRPSGRARRRAPSRARVSPRVQARAPRNVAGGAPEPEVPQDIRLVVGALAVVAVLAAVIIGVLLHSLVVGVLIAVIAVPVILSSAWVSRRW
jgi:hypothetical protein